MLELIEVQAWVIDQIQNNDIFAGVVGGSVLLSALYYLRSLPPLIGRFLQLQFTVQVVVHNSDEIFYHLETWLAKQPTLMKSRRLRLTSKIVNARGSVRDADENEERTPGYNIGPGLGWHWFFFNGRLIIFRRNESEAVNIQTMQVKESFDITIVGRKRDAFEEIVKAAYSASKIEDSLKIYTWDGYWCMLRDRQMRSLKTIVLPDEQIRRIIDDADWFCANEKWFYDRGISYHRGYLFSGQPGTGKTSMATALASHLKKDVYLLNLSSIEKDDSIIKAFSDVSKGALILIEDIDALPAIHQRSEVDEKDDDDDEDEDKKGIGISLSGLLNAIDGIATPQDCIIVMTTNHPEKIDKAVMRKGRVDIDEKLLPLEGYLIERMYIMFTGNGENARRLTHDLCEPVPAAELQGLLMEHGDNPAAIIKHAPQYFGPNALENVEVK